MSQSVLPIKYLQVSYKMVGTDLCSVNEGLKHFSVSQMQVSQRGLQTLCFDLWLNRMNDLRRLAFREQRLAIRLESCHVYTLRGVSGWVCSA